MDPTQPVSSPWGPAWVLPGPRARQAERWQGPGTQGRTPLRAPRPGILCNCPGFSVSCRGWPLPCDPPISASHLAGTPGVAPQRSVPQRFLLQRWLQTSACAPTQVKGLECPASFFYSFFFKLKKKDILFKESQPWFHDVTVSIDHSGRPALLSSSWRAMTGWVALLNSCLAFKMYSPKLFILFFFLVNGCLLFFF